MRTGIISDIHGNLQALERVLEKLDDRGIDRLLCLGDLAGYGGDVSACVRLVKERARISLLGNHDAIATALLDEAASPVTEEQLARELGEDMDLGLLAWLGSRPLSYAEADVMYTHGVPFTPEAFQYLLSLEDARAVLCGFPALPRLAFMGHSHIERTFRCRDDVVSEVLTDHLVLDERSSYIVNVGSVGQPRDRDPRAAAAIYDADAGVIEFLRVSYDVETAAARILAAGQPPFFAERLTHGR